MQIKWDVKLKNASAINRGKSGFDKTFQIEICQIVSNFFQLLSVKNVKTIKTKIKNKNKHLCRFHPNF